MSKYNELVKKLKEIFQIDKPELDFGIYRILNAKADEINNYLENTLKRKISDALASAGNANKEELERQLADAIKGAEALGVDPDNIPKVKDLRAQIAASSQGANEHENAVFTHLLTFFSRYYDSGDFVSKRRYKGDTYAIPYAGEEVMLHWANKDQYYIKSGENFSNYSFKLEDGRKVTFKLLAADTAKDNRKDNDADRRFVLVEQHTRIKYDEDGLDYEEEVLPIVVDSTGEQDELVIQFEYKAVKKGTKQEALVSQALDAILSDSNIQSGWVDMTKREPTEKNPNRTLLEKHLTTYTQRNTADYFIHKDLGGFLSNELDFYIKNEVMNLDNVQNAEVFSDIEKQLRMIQCLRSISMEIISFLAQLENFQKKLWTKKKFVTKKNYLISLKHIHEKEYSIILDNDTQVKEWLNLKVVKNLEVLDVNFLKANQSLMIDTENFDNDFIYRILKEISNVDLQTSGILINSDNYQALTLLKKKYSGKVNVTYIDPPYNSSRKDFFYKDSYRHSSWLSMIYDRINVSKDFLDPKGVFFCSIDEKEVSRLSLVCDEIFGSSNKLSDFIWETEGNKDNQGKVKGAHEYILSYTKDSNLFETPKAIAPSLKKDSKVFNDEIKNTIVKNGPKNPVKQIKLLKGFPASFKEGEIDASNVVWPKYNSNLIVKDWKLQHDVIANSGWSSKKQCEEFIENNFDFVIDSKGQKTRFEITSTGAIEGIKQRASEQSHVISIIKGVGTTQSWSSWLKDQEVPYPHYPKPINLMKYLSEMTNQADCFVLDFFGGSGSTAHAIISKNKEDSGNRKFIQIEMGDYFDTILIPRIKKVAFSDSWKKGVPESTSTGGELFQYVHLESYEDTLNNLELRKPQTTGDLFDSMPEQAKSDYLLNYMLDTESKGSLLSTDDFKKPFDYKMKIAVDSAGAFEERKIDLVETFNYLVGLHVNTVESNIERGYVRVEGNLPSGEKALVLWRDCEKIGYDDFTKFANRFDLFAKEKTFDVIYVNGDHNLPTAFTSDEGEVTRTLKLRQIEPEFLELMFAPDELA